MYLTSCPMLQFALKFFNLDDDQIGELHQQLSNKMNAALEFESFMRGNLYKINKMTFY